MVKGAREAIIVRKHGRTRLAVGCLALVSCELLSRR